MLVILNSQSLLQLSLQHCSNTAMKLELARTEHLDLELSIFGTQPFTIGCHPPDHLILSFLDDCDSHRRKTLWPFGMFSFM